MNTVYIAIQLVELVCVCIGQVYADYTLTVDLKTYQNPFHMRAQSNDCCDGNCSDPCDNRFRFCFTDAPDAEERALDLQVHPEEAVIGCQSATELVAMDDDDITFPSSGIFGRNTRNPLKFKGDIWPGSGYLLVLVFDVDRDTVDDFVDAVVVEIVPSSLKRFTDPRNYPGYFGYGTLRARYRVDCDENFFGIDCSVFCVGRDDADGHYRCNRDGERECLSGYRNISSDCTDCVPATGCSPVGGYCSLPGNCICLPGFGGSNCTEALDDSPLQCSTPSPGSTQSQSSVVYVLGVLVGVLILMLVAGVAVVIILAVYYRRRGKLRSEDDRSSRGYYVNNSMGPVQPSTNDAVSAVEDRDDNVSERSSRQYATVNSNERFAMNHVIPHNLILDSSSNSSNSSYSSSVISSPQNDVPNSSLRPNVAYGIDKNKRQRGGGVVVNGKRAPMRPPPRPPR